MLVKLSAPGLRSLSSSSEAPFVGRICEHPDYPAPARHREIYLARGQTDLPSGFRAYLVDAAVHCVGLHDVFVLSADHEYLAHGDVVRIDPRRGSLTALYRRNSESNAFLVTERCDNYCLMCSQPPKDHEDGWIVDQLREVIPLMSPDTREIGITGGEPALLGDRLVSLIDQLKSYLPRTAVHVLSNGRRFADVAFARAVGQVRHHDLMFGVPLYSDLPEEHDYVVQARGAFDETIRGILNLKRAGVRVELRFVVHAETFRRMPEFARFVARNLVFCDHVALMGLELMGFAKANLESLWIDPLDYQEELATSVRTLDAARMRVSIYNHQLCLLPPGLYRFARKSISDWKNRYFDVCDECRRKGDCGGFFASSVVRRSRGIHPLP
jgi:His-Xaa-Ser system radical SAM maturase HxsC